MYLYGMYLNNMTDGPKTPFFTLGYLQDSPIIGSSKLKMLSNIQVLPIFCIFQYCCHQKFLSWCRK